MDILISHIYFLLALSHTHRMNETLSYITLFNRAVLAPAIIFSRARAKRKKENRLRLSTSGRQSFSWQLASMTITNVLILWFAVLNVAGGKAPMQSSSEKDGVAQRAVDGSTSQSYTPQTCTLTMRERKPWWYVNLLEPYMVQLVRLDFGKPCCGKYYCISVSASSRLWKFTVSRYAGDSRRTYERRRALLNDACDIECVPVWREPFIERFILWIADSCAGNCTGICIKSRILARQTYLSRRT